MKSSNPEKSSIKGLGNDIIEVDRVRQSIERHGQHFLDRIFTKKEQEYCLKYKNSALHFAGRFAAKEAVVKALGTGFGAHISWHEVEILNEDNGKPTVSLSTKAQKKFNNPTLLISISHTEEYASSVAVWA